MDTSPVASVQVPTKTWIGEFFLLAAIWGISFLFQRLAITDFGVFALALMRVGTAALFLLPLALWYRLWPPMRQYWRAILSVGLLNSAIPFVCFAFAVQHISTGLTAILNAAVPLFGALVAWCWLGERLTLSRLVGLALGFCGIVMLSQQKADFSVGGSGWAILAALLATVCYAVAASWSRHFLSKVPPLAIAAGSQISASLVLLLPGLLSWPAHTPGLQAWGSVLVVGVVCTGFAYVLFFNLLNKIGPSRTVSLTFVIPVFALIAGVLFLDEVLTLAMLVWGAVVLSGTALATGMWTLRHRQSRLMR